jgi:putative ABC transport system permease protein
VGLAVVLLVGSGLLIKSMNALTRIDPGFEADRVLTARYNLLAPEYEDPERQALFQAELLERLRALPRVERVAAAQGTPFSGWNVNTSYEIEGEAPPPVGQSPSTHVQAITPDYFDVIGVPLVTGRMLAATDESDGVPVAVVNASFVARNFPDEAAVGKRFRLCCGEDRPWVTVVGVIADYRHYTLMEPMSPAVYIPYSQFVRSQMTLAIRTAGPPEDLIPSLNTVMAGLDPDVPAHRIQTLEEVLARETWVQRIARDILTAFASVAGLLAVVGLYGVIAYSVARQRREIGVHLALGAAPRDVLRLIVRRGLSLALIGIAIGWTTALLAARWLRQLLFQVQPADATTFALVPLVVAILATVATWIPARHAAATDPVVALRAD